MTRKIRFSGFPQGQEVSLSASQGDVSRGPVTVSAWKSAPSASVSATIARYPTGNVLPGEVITFYVTGTSGFTGSDEYEELDFEWDFGDSGATFSVAQDLPDTDANTDFGRVVAHAYTTTGAKTVTVTLRDHATGQVGTATIPITVDNPDDIAWDHDLWVSFAGNFSGAPASGGVVQHISSLSALQAVPISSAENTRITFRTGETFTWNETTMDVPGRCYIRSLDTFGSGDRPTIRAGGAASSPINFFNPGNTGDASRFAVYGVDFDGRYSPVTGRHEASSMIICGTTRASTGNLYRSFSQCDIKGVHSTYIAQGGRTTTGTERTFLGVADCDIGDWSNYGIASFGTRLVAGLAGNSIRQNPLALLRDDRNDSPYALDQAADHGPIRFVITERAGITKSAIASTTGWSGYGNDKAIQPDMRIYTQYTDEVGQTHDDVYTLSVINIQGNKGIGSSFLSLGINNDGDDGKLPAHAAIVDRNEFIQTRQHLGSFVGVKGATGVYVRNNIVYAPDVYSDLNKGLKVLSYNAPSNAPNYAAGGDTGAFVLSFNTIVSDHSSASGDDKALDITSAGDPFPTTPVVENNLVEDPNATGLTDYTPISRGDNFKPVTGSAAVDAVSSGTIPVRDFDGNLRASTTNVGAHHDQVASATAVSAPSYTSGLTIAELAAFTDEYHVNDLGTWSNLSGDDRYLIEWSWQIDGTPTTYDWLVIHRGPSATTDPDLGLVGAINSSTGILTCVITATNRSGTRVSVESNPILLS
jgi:hypothetical protein